MASKCILNSAHVFSTSDAFWSVSPVGLFAIFVFILFSRMVFSRQERWKAPNMLNVSADHAL